MSPNAFSVADYDAATDSESNHRSMPPGWAWAQLREVGTWGSGGTPGSNNPDYYNGDIPWYRITDLKGDRLPSPEKTISELGLRSSSAKLIEPPFLLVAMYGASIGKTGISTIRAATNQAIAWCRPHYAIDLDFVHFYMQYIKKSLVDQGQGGAQPNISRSILLDQPIPLAPATEQRRIVARIDELFHEIAEGEAELGRARQGLDIWRRALRKAAVTGDLTRDWREANRPAETGADSANSLGPHAIPSGWVWTTIGKAGEVLLGRQRAPQHHSGPNMRPYLRVANVLEDRIDVSDVKRMNFTPSEFEKYQLKSGDILLNEGQSADLVGRSAIYRGEIDGCCFQKTLLRFRASERLIPEYAQMVFLHYLHSKRFRRAAPITTNMAHLTLERLLPIEFPLPPREEQKVSIDLYHKMRDTIDDMYAAIGERDRVALRRSILKAAFEGRLLPQDPTDEPASVLLGRLRDGSPSNGARRRRARTAEDVSHPLLPGLTGQQPSHHGSGRPVTIK